MRGLDPRTHQKKTLHSRGWIAGSSPAMTAKKKEQHRERQ
jgi:hypothetical protein